MAAFGLVGVLDKAKPLGRPMGLVLMTGDSDHKMDVIAQRDGVVVLGQAFHAGGLGGGDTPCFSRLDRRRFLEIFPFFLRT